MFRHDWYDAEISATLDDSRRKLDGRWRKTLPSGDAIMSMTATKGDERRFLPLAEAGIEAATEREDIDVSGAWAVVFGEGEDEEPAQGELRQGGRHLTGTFLTPTGDYRYLEGSFEKGVLRLSTYDGAHLFLFHARWQDGDTLKGEFWSRDSYHTTWSARRSKGDTPVIPDGWSLVGLTNDEGHFAFSFPDLDGKRVSLDDERFAGKVVLVNIFGSWCPNCNDEAPLLADLYRSYHEQGLEIVGLAFELRADPERNGRVLRRFIERHGIEYPVLLAGTSDKKEAGKTLPDLSSVMAYPTTVFIGRDGKVRKIYTGFAGPGTGRHHEKLVREIEDLIDRLLAEKT